MIRLILMFFVVFGLCVSHLFAQEEKIQIIFRGDDMGALHSVNEACIQSYREGIMRSVEVMVPTPWFQEAVKMLNAHPELDVGVHLTLTSEWERIKWGPVSPAPSLTDAFGNFLPMTSQRRDFPPNTGFLQSGYDLKEVEQELRAQIELAKKHIQSLTHLTSHMNTPTSTPQLQEIVEKLAQEFGLPLELPVEVKRFQPYDWRASAEEKIKGMIKALQTAEPGLYLYVDHPGLDTAEMRAVGHIGYEDVAEDRAGVTRVLTDAKVWEIIRQRDIQLLSYGDVIREYRKKQK